MRRKKNYDNVNTLIGEKTYIEGGILKSSEALRIDGTYIGDIECNSNICIGISGNIKGNIISKSILVGGIIEGNIEAEDEIHLAQTCNIIGDITCKNLIVDEGANFQGNCNMTTNNKKTKKENTQENKNKNENVSK